MIKRHIHDNVK